MLVSYFTNRFRKSRQAMLQSVFFGVTTLLSLRFQAATFLQSLRNDPLQLPVCASELIGSPFFERIHGFRIHPQHKTFD